MTSPTSSSSGSGRPSSPHPSANTTPGSITTDPAWDGLTNLSVVTAEPIAAGTSHVYRVTVTATIDSTTATTESSDCVLDQGETGTGWLNQAGLTVNGVDSDASDCAHFPILHVTKTVIDGPTGQGDGTTQHQLRRHGVQHRHRRWRLRPR